MEKIVRQALLYDFYGELLTEHQKRIYEEVVIEDLSYTEIGNIEGISRQGVYDLIKRCDKILEEYEAKLKLIEKFEKAKSMVLSISDIANKLKDNNDNKVLNNDIDEIVRLSKAIYEEI